MESVIIICVTCARMVSAAEHSLRGQPSLAAHVRSYVQILWGQAAPGPGQQRHFDWPRELEVCHLHQSIIAMPLVASAFS
mgnify:CR=1 FL=1